jgi:hypothetical protein
MGLFDLTCGKVKDDSGKIDNPGDYQTAITAALKRYSKHRPLNLVADIPGDGGHDYSLPEGWNPGLSGILCVEFPAGLIPEVILDSRDYKLYQSPAGQKLRILNIIPTAEEAIRVTYNGLHTEETLPEADQEAVASLAASICCGQLAAAFGNTSDPTIQADVVNYRTKTDEFRRLADFLEGQYKEHLGIFGVDSTPAAMAVSPASEDKRLRITHGRR